MTFGRGVAQVIETVKPTCWVWPFGGSAFQRVLVASFQSETPVVVQAPGLASGCWKVNVTVWPGWIVADDGCGALAR